MKTPITYIHTPVLHNTEAPSIIVPEIIKLLHPKSVVDIGCGLGTFVKCFKDNGVSQVLGVDGPWVNKELLFKNITPEDFLEKDLEKELKGGLNLGKEFDLVVSLEVAEHISEEHAGDYVENLVSAGKVILFSASIPLQGGQNHVNEQLLPYWQDLFLKHDYVVHDIFKSMFWDNPDVFWWYKQNMVLVTPRDYKFTSKMIYNTLNNVVHYELFTEKATELEQLTVKMDELKNGKAGIALYLKFLIKSLIGADKFRKLKYFLKWRLN